MNSSHIFCKEESSIKIVKYLINEKKKMDVNTKDKFSNSALDYGKINKNIRNELNNF
jgi:hypothetical protein